MSESLEDVVDEPYEGNAPKPDMLDDDLFGDEDDDDYQQPQRQPEQDRGGEDDEDEEDALIDTDPAAASGHGFEDVAPAAVPGSMTAADRKARMAELVQRTKQAEAAAEEESADEGEGGKRRRRPPGSDIAKRRKAEQAAPGGAGAGEDLAAGDDENSEEFVENEADRVFIDDAGVEPRPGGSDDEFDGPPRPPPEEALEASEGDEDDVDKALKAAKRKKVKHSEQQLQLEVDDLLAKMEAAAEDDFELMARNAGIELGKDDKGNFARDSNGQLVIASRTAKPGRAQPALNKFRMLSEVSEFVNQRKYHELFLASGGLGVLKAWLEPYMDGSLPNVRVRALVLKCCQILPIDTKRDDVKDSLKKSQLAKRVMFLTKCQDETAENKRLADSIVREWSSNIFYDPEMEAEKRRMKEEQQLHARQIAQRAKEQAPADTPTKRQPRSGEPGYRVHAAIPQASKLDYLVNPGSKDLKEASNAPGRKPGDGVVMKKMREVLKKNKLTTARAMEPSVEGRGIVMYNQ